MPLTIPQDREETQGPTEWTAVGSWNIHSAVAINQTELTLWGQAVSLSEQRKQLCYPDSFTPS